MDLLATRSQKQCAEALGSAATVKTERKLPKKKGVIIQKQARNQPNSTQHQRPFSGGSRGQATNAAVRFATPISVVVSSKSPISVNAKTDAIPTPPKQMLLGAISPPVSSKLSSNSTDVIRANKGGIIVLKPQTKNELEFSIKNGIIDCANDKLRNRHARPSSSSPLLPKHIQIQCRSLTESQGGHGQVSSSHSSPSSWSISSSSPNNSPPCKRTGGILRLNSDSMKLLESSQPIKSSQPTIGGGRKSNAAEKPKIDFVHTLVEKLEHVIKKSGGSLSHTTVQVDVLRRKLIAHYEKLLLSDLTAARRDSALQTIWQKCFYPFITTYRVQLGRSLPDTTAKNVLLESLHSIITEGTTFFSSLTEKLRLNYYNFTFRSLVERDKHKRSDRIRFDHLQELTHIMRLCFVYQGDLERYAQGMSFRQGKLSFEQAKRFYMKAHLLMPQYAHASAQLALASNYQKNSFDAIYYYIRSFETDAGGVSFGDCSNRSSANTTVSSITSSAAAESSMRATTRHASKQILTVLFEDIRPAYEKFAEKLKMDHQSWVERTKPARDRLLGGNSEINTYDRIEYWVTPSGSAISKCDMHHFYDLAAIVANQAQLDLLYFYREHVLPTLDFGEVKARFLSSFLMVHAMLNCRSGLDRFFDVANQMLVEFDCLLWRRYRLRSGATTSGQCLSAFLLIQTLVINMYTISNTLTDEDRDKNAAQYSFTHANAYFIMSSMVSAIFRRATALFDAFHRDHLRWQSTVDSSLMTKASQQSCKKTGQYLDEEEDEVFAHIDRWFEFCTSTLESLYDDDGGASERSNVFDELIDLYHLLPCLKTWSDWVMSARPRFPPAELCELRAQKSVDGKEQQQSVENIWQVVARFLTHLEHITSGPIVLHDGVDDDGDVLKNQYELVKLPEDRCLESFKLITSRLCKGQLVKLPFVSEIAFIYLRIGALKKFGHFLCGEDYLRLRRRDESRCCFESVIGLDDIEGEAAGVKVFGSSIVSSTTDLSKKRMPSTIDRSFAEYVKLRKELDHGSKEIIENDESDFEFELDCDSTEDEDNDSDKFDTCTKKAMDSNLATPQTSLFQHNDEMKRRFIIRPRFVIFDTNCFINDFESIKRFIRTAPFVVTIPLIVIHELEWIHARGTKISADLASGTTAANIIKPEKDLDKFVTLATMASEILHYLKEEAFVKHKLSVRAVTSKGSLLKSLDYKEEFYNPHAFNNDDLVLYACTNLSKSSEENNNAKTGGNMQKLLQEAGELVSDNDEYIFRDVVLITDDFNLRLKSLCFEVPVRKLRQFVHWTRTF